ncbi:MAG: hypothetical protein Ct9H90mP10_01750 [Actinomycetota bacterium]|nr:MAG: hypothetical protein Ct9H90mP10_01750 [Actinomycetota bacterium]
MSGLGIFLVIDNNMSTWGTELLVFIFAGIVIGLHSFASKIKFCIKRYVEWSYVNLNALVVVYLATINI